MEDKKMPFAVFVLKYIENMVEQYKEWGHDEFEVLDTLIPSCGHCPLGNKCLRIRGLCRETIIKYVESAE